MGHIANRDTHRRCSISLGRGDSTMERMFADGNWDIDYVDDKEFQHYVESEVPEFGSLEFYNRTIVGHLKTIDANGFIAVKPYEISYQYDDIRLLEMIREHN